METVSVPKTGNAHILWECFRLLRVEQYTKNLIIFLPCSFRSRSAMRICC